MTFLRGDVAERLHRPVQASEGFPDRNQPAALTLHGFSFSHDGRSEKDRKTEALRGFHLQVPLILPIGSTARS